MNAPEHIISGLPDPEAAVRFLRRLEETQGSAAAMLRSNQGLLSDVLTIVAFSPLLATTLLQNPAYLKWLDRRRKHIGVTSKEEFSQELARFALTNSQLPPQVLFARFRRRELMRIYLKDIRRLATIAEVTEEISNLADAILEAALEHARREIDNRYGIPQAKDEKGRLATAALCVVALGKLGSRELNYSSDIDLLFLYSDEGTTSGTGTRGSVTNREYFIKLAEHLTRLVGENAGEGGAYRVDLRLRPHGRLGALAISLADAAKYYRTEARGWERQVLIRSRSSAGESAVFESFIREIQGLVFDASETVESALESVRRSKVQIDTHLTADALNVKLGRGGIREIEFIAQGLQLAFAGRDAWMKSPHTLVSLARSAERGHITSGELSKLSAAYDLLRRTEHILQMENGLQTHTLPLDKERLALIERRVKFATGADLATDLPSAMSDVAKIFDRIFKESAAGVSPRHNAATAPKIDHPTSGEIEEQPGDGRKDLAHRVQLLAPRFAYLFAAGEVDESTETADLRQRLISAVEGETSFRGRLGSLRRAWSRCLKEIVAREVSGEQDLRELKQMQTALAEASLAAAHHVVLCELSSKFGYDAEELPLAALALGKFGGRGLDYDSDLDLVFVHDDSVPLDVEVAQGEFYGRAVELFVTTLSSMTREGSLYRLDLRLRPYGSKGLSSTPGGSLIEYLNNNAEIWELLAYVKLRATSLYSDYGRTIEAKARQAVHERARGIAAARLAGETRRIRDALEQQRSTARRTTEIDIKYGEGGMLDVYFAARFLQLRDFVADEDDGRSTSATLLRLLERGLLSKEVYEQLISGYEFLSRLDHNLRLTIGRTTRLSLADDRSLSELARRMDMRSVDEFKAAVSLNRVAVRSAYEQVVVG
jgi:[glutamine synthetase] adenylyltransferase / [glutamine synthetase]-adenylyl-L-tyrosine phosphorylase